MALSKTLRRHRGLIAIGTLVATGAIAFAIYQQSGSEVPAVAYTTERASIGTLSVTVASTGNLEIDGTTEVYPSVSGGVASVAVSTGSTVTTGTVLFTLDSSGAKATTARALASYRQAQQQVAQSEQQVSKTEQSLTEVTARSKEPTPTADATDVAAAKAELASAEAGLVAARAQLATALLDYESARDAEADLTVTAPCSGVVWSLDIEAGDTVSPSGGSSTSSSSSQANTEGAGSSTSSAPVVIAPEQPLALHLMINEVDLPSLAVGQRADIVFDAFPDLTATGKVYEIADEGTNSQGVITFDVWISLDVAAEGLRARMSAAATIVTEVATNTLVVPNAAVKSDDDGGSYVEVLVAGDESPRRVTVETGLSSATQTEILEGLSEGDAVVTQTVDSSAESDTGSQQAPGRMMIPGMGGGRG